MLHRSIAVSNGKGGAGKTSLAAHLAALAGDSGWRVLAVDLDPQGNLGQDLGYFQAGRSDGGAGLARAVMDETAAEPVRDVRPGLDVLSAGEQTEDLLDHLGRRYRRDPAALLSIERALAPIAEQYQLIVFDCPPGDRLMLDAALTAAHYIVIPTQADDGSLLGLQRVARRFSQLRSTTNPALELLGVALFNLGANDRRIHAEVRSDLSTALRDVAPVFEAFIRHARKASRDMRRRGQLAFEYHESAKDARPWYDRQPGEAPEGFASNAADLSGDYQRLCGEILQRYIARHNDWVELQHALVTESSKQLVHQ